MEKKHAIEKSEILSGIKEQIVTFDNKANILITVLGIVFALSLSTIDLFAIGDYGWWVYLIFGAYILSLIASICLSLCAIIPRKRKKKYANIEKSCTYYGDLKDMNEDEFNSAFNQENHFEQIKTNSGIAWRKHSYIRATIFSLIPVGLFFIALIIVILI